MSPRGQNPSPTPNIALGFSEYLPWNSSSWNALRKWRFPWGGDSPLGQSHSHTPTERVWEVLQWKKLLIFSGPRTGQLYLILRSRFLWPCWSPSLGRAALCSLNPSLTSLPPVALSSLAVPTSQLDIRWGVWLTGSQRLKIGVLDSDSHCEIRHNFRTKRLKSALRGTTGEARKRFPNSSV